MATCSRANMNEVLINKKNINILLLGESGVGKSTFINSVINYMRNETLQEAVLEEVQCLIPTKFSIPDENYVERTIKIGSDENEDEKIGNSSTKGSRAYVFPFGDDENGQSIRFIDTPGIGDSRGKNQDKLNFENILAYLGQFEELHAICILLKPNVTVINPFFKFCIMNLMSRLEKSASKNILFLFTNTRSTFYRPGDTLAVLRRVLDEIKQSPPYVEIPCSKENMFCVDNEAFKFLVALKEGIHFGEQEMNEYSGSWKTSVETVWRMFTFIMGDDKKPGLKSHQIQNTISVNEARRVIINLSKPLADISDLIQDNLASLDRHGANVTREGITIAELKDALFIPVMDIRLIQLKQPITVCTASKCSELIKVGQETKYHYKQICHNPCYLENVPVELIGTPDLELCHVMGIKGICTECDCSFQVHMHINYETEIYQTKADNLNAKPLIKSKKDFIKIQHDMVDKLQKRSAEYQNEMEIISREMAKFAHFLKENSLSPGNDVYDDYLNYLIEREICLGSLCNKDIVNRHMQLKKEYEVQKRVLDSALKDKRKFDVNSSVVSPHEIFTGIQVLYNLPHTGEKIRQLYESQQVMCVQTHQANMEYLHPKKVDNNKRSFFRNLLKIMRLDYSDAE